jgi:hypothetical protein
MDTVELSDVTAGPIQVVGMSFYFDPLTVQLGDEMGLHRFQFYGLGRGGFLVTLIVRSLTTGLPSFILASTISSGISRATKLSQFRRRRPT